MQSVLTDLVLRQVVIIIDSIDWTNITYLVVSPTLKNRSQNRNLPQIRVKIQNIWNHHPVTSWWFPQLQHFFETSHRAATSSHGRGGGGSTGSHWHAQKLHRPGPCPRKRRKDHVKANSQSFQRIVLDTQHVPRSINSLCWDGHPTFKRNPYNGYINHYYWVDDRPLLYGNTGSLDPIAHIGKGTMVWSRFEIQGRF